MVVALFVAVVGCGYWGPNLLRNFAVEPRAAAPLLHSGRVDAVVVGADRIAANGDTANKVGTFGLALAARHAGIPFYVAAPRSTFDLSVPSGDAIVIEERPAFAAQ